MTTLSLTGRSRLRRHRERGSHDRALAHRILDEGLICHVGFVVDGEPVVLPTAYGRIGDFVYLHGAAASRMLQLLGAGARVCLTVTLVDGLVLARSAFHHSMNYRSLVLFGPAREVTDPDERRRALDAIVEHVVLGRTPAVRAPNAPELARTRVVAVPIDEGSVKVRSGPPVDDADDLSLPHWAGVIPLQTTAGAPEPAPELGDDAATPPHVWSCSFRGEGVREERRGDLLLSSDRGRLDIDTIHEFLSERSYWARGIPRARLERALRGSLCAGAWSEQRFAGFARVVTDRATFAWLCDVFVLEPYRGRGIGKALVELLRSAPELSGVRRWMLGTLDAHELYTPHGFRPLEAPERFLEIVSPY